MTSESNLLQFRRKDEFQSTPEVMEIVKQHTELFEKLLDEYLMMPSKVGKMIAYSNADYDPTYVPVTIVFGVFFLHTEFGQKIGFSNFRNGIRGGGIYADDKKDLLDVVRNRLQQFHNPTSLSNRLVGLRAGAPHSRYGFSIINWEI